VTQVVPAHVSGLCLGSGVASSSALARRPSLCEGDRMRLPRLRKSRLVAGGDSEAPHFDLDAPGSRFTMRPALAVGLGPDWMERSEEKGDFAKAAISSEFGKSWLDSDPDLGRVKVLKGTQGRGAAGWIPVVEWLGLHAAGGLVGLGASQAARAGIRRIRERIRQAKASNRRPLVSRGLAAFLAMEHVFETTDETQILHVEFAQEPSVLGGRSPTEPSYTGLEPWIVSLVNGSRRTRYVLVVSAEGDIEGCTTVPAGEFEPMFGLLPPTE
jgi:hypothetical protein